MMNSFLKNALEKLKKSPEKKIKPELDVFSVIDTSNKNYVTLKIKCYPSYLKFQCAWIFIVNC